MSIYADIGRLVLIKPVQRHILAPESRQIDGRPGAFYMHNLAEQGAAKAESDVEKVTVRLTGQALSQVRKLALDQGITVNEFMRRAVNTEAYFLGEVQNGSKILVEDTNSRIKQVVFR